MKQSPLILLAIILGLSLGACRHREILCGGFMMDVHIQLDWTYEPEADVAEIDAALVPNVGAELLVGKRWSARGEYMHAWCGGGNRVWRIYGGDAEVRYWFDNSERHVPMEGNHLGVFANLFTYDFKPYKNKAGIQSPDYSYFGPTKLDVSLVWVIGCGLASGQRFSITLRVLPSL